RLDHEQGARVHGVRAADRRLRPARAPLLRGRRRALRHTQSRGRSGRQDRDAARRPGAAPDHGELQPPALPRAHGLGVQRGRVAARVLDAVDKETGRVSVVLAESGRSVGGTERVVWELATRLPPARFDVGVWLSDAPGVDEFAAALGAREIAVMRVPEVDSRWDWKGMLDTWKLLRRAKPDLLHVHHVWPAADRYLTSLASLAGVGHLIVTEHIEGRSHSDAQRRLKRSELQRADAVTVVS